MWILDLLDDVESDFSVFHGIEDPMSMEAPRFFRLAERLVHYDGAVRHSMALALHEAREAGVVEPEPRRELDEGSPARLEALAASSEAGHRQGFPAIEYKSRR
jgi:hypothetical protein